MFRLFYVIVVLLLLVSLSARSNADKAQYYQRFDERVETMRAAIEAGAAPEELADAARQLRNSVSTLASLGHVERMDEMLDAMCLTQDAWVRVYADPQSTPRKLHLEPGVIRSVERRVRGEEDRLKLDEVRRKTWVAYEAYLPYAKRRAVWEPLTLHDFLASMPGMVLSEEDYADKTLELLDEWSSMIEEHEKVGQRVKSSWKSMAAAINKQFHWERSQSGLLTSRIDAKQVQPVLDWLEARPEPSFHLLALRHRMLASESEQDRLAAAEQALEILFPETDIGSEYKGSYPTEFYSTYYFMGAVVRDAIDVLVRQEKDQAWYEGVLGGVIESGDALPLVYHPEATHALASRLAKIQSRNYDSAVKRVGLDRSAAPGDIAVLLVALREGDVPEEFEQVHRRLIKSLTEDYNVRREALEAVQEVNSGEAERNPWLSGEFVVDEIEFDAPVADWGVLYAVHPDARPGEDLSAAAVFLKGLNVRWPGLVDRGRFQVTVAAMSLQGGGAEVLHRFDLEWDAANSNPYGTNLEYAVFGDIFVCVGAEDTIYISTPEGVTEIPSDQFEPGKAYTPQRPIRVMQSGGEFYLAGFKRFARIVAETQEFETIYSFANEKGAGDQPVLPGLRDAAILDAATDPGNGRVWVCVAVPPYLGSPPKFLVLNPDGGGLRVYDAPVLPMGVHAWWATFMEESPVFWGIDGGMMLTLEWPEWVTRYNSETDLLEYLEYPRKDLGEYRGPDGRILKTMPSLMYSNRLGPWVIILASDIYWAAGVGGKGYALDDLDAFDGSWGVQIDLETIWIVPSSPRNVGQGQLDEKRNVIQRLRYQAAE
ncbi:hypothetical protein [Algisphaera agarilytica]|uniref:HEAT repeat domain-containing protein n=1 Tax=Algisphaera agarilytica TaxID=1385975 RepID=A0A7X0H735_9BACT|nr:hypothetical protein [Algisphaera agarilytica]MBB6430496.1 hypothetical protein [Algisphaera agarilytica]